MELASTTVVSSLAADLWDSGSTALRAQLAEGTWNTWFREVRPVRCDGSILVLAVPSAVACERIRSSYTGLLTDLLHDATGRDLAVELVVDTAPRRDDPVVMTPPPAPETPAAMSTPSPVATPGGGLLPPAADESPAPWTALNPRYTFDQFVIGASNRFAHAAALSVAENPARSYNPLFIYGPAGLGKTHLLHAIGNYVRDVHKLTRVRYVSTETLMNEFVDAIRNNAGNAFRRRYREVDVLLVDDIQFLERSQQLQEEFFHTFNSLHGAGNQIVLSSDRPPKQIPRLEDRLRTRLEWGLITDVQPPEFETRLAILRMKAEAEALEELPAEVLNFIASNISDNVRQLEGALIRVAAYSSLNRLPLSEDVARQVLIDLLPPVVPRVITPELILDETAKMFGFTVEDLCGRSRRRPLVIARQIGMYVFRELTDFSYPKIAEEFGGRDHTTVIHAVEKIKGLMTERHNVFDQVNELMGRIRLGTGG
ncbi:MAG TPA: chromosomal replication initiator protein DnaA [Acidimicrobiia bacterium]|jgi:chromosomal replication initiator protein|nr:chromosomal replication initiator protein DnaA [Nocardioides sp.]